MIGVIVMNRSIPESEESKRVECSMGQTAGSREKEIMSNGAPSRKKEIWVPNGGKVNGGQDHERDGNLWGGIGSIDLI